MPARQLGLHAYLTKWSNFSIHSNANYAKKMVLSHHFLRLSSSLRKGGFFFLIGVITGKEIIFLFFASKKLE